MFRPIPAPVLQIITHLVRILPSLLQNHLFFPVKTRVPRRLWRLWRLTRVQGSALGLLIYRGQHVQACTCIDVQESQSNWQEMRKTLGKPGFCSKGCRKLTLQKANGEDRNRTTYKFPGKNRGSKMRRREIRRAPQNTPCAACCMRALRLSLGH